MKKLAIALMSATVLTATPAHAGFTISTGDGVNGYFACETQPSSDSNFSVLAIVPDGGQATRMFVKTGPVEENLEASFHVLHTDDGRTILEFSKPEAYSLHIDITPYEREPAPATVPAWFRTYHGETFSQENLHCEYFRQ